MWLKRVTEPRSCAITGNCQRDVETFSFGTAHTAATIPAKQSLCGSLAIDETFTPIKEQPSLKGNAMRTTEWPVIAVVLLFAPGFSPAVDAPPDCKPVSAGLLPSLQRFAL